MIGDNINDLLKKKSITAYKLAKDGHVSHSYLSEILNNKKSNPSIEVLSKIATTLNVTLDELTKK